MNEVHLTGRITSVRQRWTPDGSKAVVAALELPRPELGAARESSPQEQPLPVRASGLVAEQIAASEGAVVHLTGVLRRRYYSRNQEPYWGQVEIWVSTLATAQPAG